MPYTPPSPESQITTHASDQTIGVVNPLPAPLQLVKNFNPNRIITHSLNPAGNPLTNYDPVNGQYFAADDQIVTDEQGNLVTT